jgi:HPt (histidine-containing phosphotransfer) domain-containing protein/CheY-like chemotaxis protein
MAGNTPGTPPDVQTMLRQLRASYVSELEEKLDEIEVALLALEDAARFAQSFEDSYRRVHSLKGSAGTYGIPIISKICHQLEEYLSVGADAPDKVSRQVLDQCLAHVDLMRQAREMVTRGAEDFQDIEERLDSLRAFLLGDRYSVLVVETSKVNIRLCSEIMSGFPLHVTVLDNGVHALERLLHERYHILITGYEVKMLNGLALVAAVRLSNRGNQNIKAILLSSQKQRLFRRDTDPDYMIPRDVRFPENLSTAIQTCLTALRESAGA